MSAHDAFLKAATAHLQKALEVIASILQDETAKPATKLRAAFGIIELALGRPLGGGRRSAPSDPSALARPG